ncbi:MAG: hypothetical protein H0X66_13860 [Verrucomicrobia bacterium]|nr:hypothetical protein [Verrucomicrobiota bacterium]
MSELFDKSRRIAGVVFLGIALLMVVLGQTVLSPVLKNVSFILYWLTCAAFTLSAASVALVDLARVKKASREKQRDLIEETLEQIERDKHKFGSKKNNPDKSV